MRLLGISRCCILVQFCGYPGADASGLLVRAGGAGGLGLIGFVFVCVWGRFILVILCGEWVCADSLVLGLGLFCA